VTREEARKFWEYIPCNECIYVAELPNVYSERAHIFAEKYVRNDHWLHIRWSEVEPRQAGDYCNEVLIEVVHLDEPFPITPKFNGPITAVDGNGPMFVEIPQFVELPEFVSVHGIRSVIRLKRIQGTVNARMEQRTLLPVGLIGSTNREANFGSGSFVGRNRTRKQVDQIPGELVESPAETVDEIPNTERDLLIRRSSLRDNEKVLRSIKVVFFGNRIRDAFDPVAKLLLSRLKVKVSPSGFHIDILN
jgi:hypothetical protein